MNELISQEDMSQNINELAAALAKAQSSIMGASKDKKNPHFKSSYADLSSCWEACRDAVTSNGLSVVQTVKSIDNGQYVMVTRLLHSSGQWIKGYIPLINNKGDMQGLGSAITYARRFGLTSIVGVAPEDDDGNKACEAPPLLNKHQLAALNEFIKLDKNQPDLMDKMLKKCQAKSVEQITQDKFEKLIQWIEERQEKQIESNPSNI